MQGAVGMQGGMDREATQRMLQSMPSADFIAKALSMDKSNIESLQQQQQGNNLLAQKLAQIGVQPGASHGTPPCLGDVCAPPLMISPPLYFVALFF